MRIQDDSTNSARGGYRTNNGPWHGPAMWTTLELGMQEEKEEEDKEQQKQHH